MLAALQQANAPSWDEIIVANALDATEGFALAHSSGVHRRAAGGSAFADLKALRQSEDNAFDAYLGGLGKNTRSQIRRSLRLYEERGPVKMERARCIEEAKSFFRRNGRTP